MPILTIQRRLHEAGRIRIGEKREATNRQGQPIMRPAKLDRFRLTSRNRTPLDAAAELYGGHVRPWDAPDGQQWEVITDSQALPVIVPPGDIAFTQWLEAWSGGGCLRRCDGETEQLTGQPCICAGENEPACKPHTRLSVMLRDLPGLGVWRLDTQGWNAATELGGAVDVCQQAMARGRLLPATLRLEVREQRKPGEPVRKFAVPLLDVGVRLDQLGLVMGAGDAALPTLDAPDEDLRALPAPAAPADVVEEGPRFGPVPADAQSAPAVPVDAQLAEFDAQTAAAPARRRGRANAAAPIPPTGVSVGGPGTSSAGTGPVGPGPGAGSAPPEGGGEASVPGPAPTEPTDDDGDVELVNEEGARTIAKRCRDAGIGDDLRPAFLGALSSGAWWSAHEVPVAMLGRVFATCDDVAAGRIQLVFDDKGAPRLVGTDGTVLAYAPTPAAATPAGSEAHWKRRLGEIRGLGPSRLLRRARELVSDLDIDVDVPGALGDITDPQLTAALDAWLDEQAAERSEGAA